MAGLAQLPVDNVFARLTGDVGGVLTERLVGRIASIQGLNVIAAGVPAPLGARCRITTRFGAIHEAEVVGLREDSTLLTVFDDASGLTPGDRVECISGTPAVPVGLDLVGRIIDAQGRPLDGKPTPLLHLRYPLHAAAPNALRRAPIDAPLGLGVRAIDGLLTAGRGQRLGIFAGTGVGKSVLMGMLCRHTQADVNVVVLVGERGREVRDFVEKQLGAEGMARSVVVVCTSDVAPALRVRACFHATAVAEYFRDLGMNVLLMVDSLTRMAMAQRQLGLSAGEPPTVKGYPPSVFAQLPRLLERAGRTDRGSITGIYTVLVEGGDIEEPLADAVRGILDGHIWLSRDLANKGHYPAIDVLASISRVAIDVIAREHEAAAVDIRRALATWREIEDLVSVGAYAPGRNPDHDVAVQTRKLVQQYLQQPRDAGFSMDENTQATLALGELLRKTRQQVGGGQG